MSRTRNGIACALLVGLVFVSVVPHAIAADSTHTSVEMTRPVASAEETTAPDDSGPVGIWPPLVAGKGADSRTFGTIDDPLEVRWTFALRGVPDETEFALWAVFAQAGEIQAVGKGQVTISTGGHDVLDDADAHCILPSIEMAEGVALELVSVEVVSGPAPTPQPTRPDAMSATPIESQGSMRAPRTISVGTEQEEPYLPFTGSNEALPLLALVCAALGVIARHVSGRGWSPTPATSSSSCSHDGRSGHGRRGTEV